MIIGLTGFPCSGKDEMAKYLETKGFHHISLSDILREIILKKRKKITANELIKTGNELRRKKGHGIIARMALASLEPNKNYIITSIRNPVEIEVLKTRKDFILVNIEAPSRQRFKRMHERQREGTKITFEDFKDREKKERSDKPEELRVHDCVKLAKVKIVNDKRLTEFLRKIDRFLKDWKPKLDKRVGWDEYFLGLIDVVARRATCDRGKTAVIIVKNKRILTTGYVGSPIGLPHCDDVGHMMRSLIAEDGTQSRHCIRTIHGELNAIAQAARNGISIDGATLYCKMTPCFTCAKAIINSGIKRVVAKIRYHADQLTLETFKKAGVKLNILENKLEKYKDQ